MVWTIEEFSYLFDAPYPATKGELIEYAERIGAPDAVIQNLQALEEDEEGEDSMYNGPDEICPYLEIPNEDPYDEDNSNY